MAEINNSETSVVHYLRALKNQPAITTALILVMIAIGTSTLTESISGHAKLFTTDSGFSTKIVSISNEKNNSQCPC